MIEAKDISDVRVALKPDRFPFLGYASCVLCGSVKIHDFKIVSIYGKAALVFPTRKNQNIAPDTPKREHYFNILHPIDEASRAVFEEAILGEYHRVSWVEIEQEQETSHVVA